MNNIDEHKKLTAEIRALQTEYTELTQNRKLRLGLFGIQGAAKTSWLTSLLLFPNGVEPTDEVDIVFEEESELYLQGIKEVLSIDGKMPATSAGEPANIQFTLRLPRRNQAGEKYWEKWDIETRDFTGGVLKPSSASDFNRESIELCRRYLQECDVVICFHYWNERDLSFIHGFRTLVERQKECSLVYAITRLDERRLPTSTEDWESMVDELATENPVFDKALKKVRILDNRDGKIWVVPVCPFGVDVSSLSRSKGPDGTTIPLDLLDELKPSRIYRPLVHAVNYRRGKEVECREALKKLLSDRKELEERSERERLQAEAAQAAEAARVEAERAAEVARTKSEQQQEENRIRGELLEYRADIETARKEPATADDQSLEDARGRIAELVRAAARLGKRDLIKDARALAREYEELAAVRDNLAAVRRLGGEYRRVVADTAAYVSGGQLPADLTADEVVRQLTLIQQQAEDLNNAPLAEDCQVRIEAVLQRRDRPQRQLRRWAVIGLALVAVALAATAACLLLGRGS